MDQPKPGDFHRYVDDDGQCSVCGATAGRLTGYRRGRDGTMRLPSRFQWHRTANEAERATGAKWVIKSPQVSGEIRQVRDALIIPGVPIEVLKAVAYIAAGDTVRGAARRAEISAGSLSAFKTRHATIWQTIVEQAEAIAKVLIERGKAKGIQEVKQRPALPIVPCDLPTLDDGEGITLASFFEKVYMPMRLLGRSPRTADSYRSTIATLDRYAGRPVRLQDLSDELLGNFMASHLERGHSPYTANKSRRNIAAVWRLAYKRKLVTTLPDLSPVRVFKKVPDAWSMSEFARILQAAGETPGKVDGVLAGKFWPALLLCLYDTGLRGGAMLRLKRTALDMETGWLNVPAEIQKHGCGQMFLLHGETLQAIQSMSADNQTHRLFPWPHRYEAILRGYKDILERAGLPSGYRDKFHKIRRTSATAVADKLGRSAAMDHLGHSAMSVTERYLDPTKITRIQAVSVMNRPTTGSEGIQKPK